MSYDDLVRTIDGHPVREYRDFLRLVCMGLEAGYREAGAPIGATLRIPSPFDRMIRESAELGELSEEARVMLIMQGLAR